MNLQPLPSQVRILVLDDNVDAADSLSRLLSLMGHEAHPVYTGASAIALARDWKPDLVLVDLNLPDMTGYEVAKVIRAAAWHEIKIVAVTGWMRDRRDDLLQQAGFDDYLTKPVPVAALSRYLPLARPDRTKLAAPEPMSADLS